ncbi:hypothetical protein CC1G_11613 [Coprinopsis cinerea okayama7|uniref:Uncharacterized protein n=1 Tax=Coprinopsis cinerea (strain Okayama-7 / 130 / ATCC MYA-4618 / FGSC 9003) TaxID=240176 RepID=A8PCR7_COPC7|nr:hypothetical protein CC1G_11613 [Coprinopsis cinerea okayama7\|eukprot:XP_001840456.2 hypothetical protein CC1G_11613 [Coprinopsis cinerea okayama7\
MADSSAPTSELTPPSSSSSLSGAMGGDGSRSSRSPPSTSVYGGHGSMPQDLTWNNQQMSSGVGMVPMNGTTYPGVTGGFSPSVSNLYDYHTTRNGSPTESISSQNPQAYPGAYDQYGLSRNSHMGMSSHRSNGYTSNPLAPFPQPAELSMPVNSSSAESEIRRLRRRVRELEMENSRARNALESLRSNAPNPAGLPTPPHSSSFQAGWKARTEARKKLFCSLNRAGNALCAWHDSRRERRAYPPRNAPPGYLNCGCTYEQALFEESLARHGVGSYHPGETVRMDPALRNPLLKLLEQRYGYKDGDFEHDPLTEEWHEGESPAVWEQKVLSGQAVRRRPDNHSHDRR